MTKRVKITEPAKRDLDDIFLFSKNKYGEIQAKNYATEIIKSIDLLSEMPDMGISVDEFGKGLQILPKERHCIVYQNREQEINIVGIIHKSRKLEKLLERPKKKKKRKNQSRDKEHDLGRSP